jgi:hypothetical protein
MYQTKIQDKSHLKCENILRFGKKRFSLHFSSQPPALLTAGGLIVFSRKARCTLQMIFLNLGFMVCKAKNVEQYVDVIWNIFKINEFPKDRLQCIILTCLFLIRFFC